ncbi:hypothetical protein H072_9771 [Dactylellina haptotyla CBS 200.50]|uniref:Uncharacterized protein n=1 Tax=Dactylellina haptotyla (strain CBS 200.50) TaxID=1284197 RepID=S8BBV0_DACHA|nr:hypothetical protein H072_9771 [Dactylellina haptotyla CBS 200.50]
MEPVHTIRHTTKNMMQYAAGPLTPPTTPKKEKLQILQTLQAFPAVQNNLPTPPPSPQSKGDSAPTLLANGGQDLTNSAVYSEESVENIRLSEKELYERQKAIFLQNARELRKQHYTRIAAQKMAKYISLSFSWAVPIKFEGWICPLPETIQFERREVMPGKFQKDATFSFPLYKPSIEELNENILVVIMMQLDFPSTQSMRLASKKLNTIYENNWEDICDRILPRTRQLSYIPGYLLPAGSVEENSEIKMRQHCYCISWTVQKLLLSFREIDEKYRSEVLQQGLRRELYKAGEIKALPNESPQPKVLKGATYPFSQLLEFLLEKNFGGPRRSKENLPRYLRNLTMLERGTALDKKEAQMALKWMIELILWYLGKDRAVYYAINDCIAGAEDDDILISQEEYSSFLLGLKPVQLWELVRLVGIKSEEIIEIMKSRGFWQPEVWDSDGVDSGDLQEEFILARVRQILGL